MGSLNAGFARAGVTWDQQNAGVPVEPPPNRWQLPPPDAADEDGIAGIGADLEPGTLLAAYRDGLFPMHLFMGGPLAWWSPQPRGILPLDGIRVTRSLKKSCRRFEIRVDWDFDAVVAACAGQPRPGGWISKDIASAYGRLHRLGWAHSVEAWDPEADQLVGGLYGIGIGGLFAGESMFHRATDASKAALVALVEILREDGHPDRLLDVQWVTPHLAALGATGISRDEYLARLGQALQCPQAPAFASG